MSVEYTPLNTQSLDKCNQIIENQDLPEVVHLDDPAQNVMIDFCVMQPATIGPERPMSEARKIMEDGTLHFCFVTDDNDCVEGIVTLKDILSEKPVKIQQENRIERKQLKVKHLMIPIKKLESVDYDSLQNIRVGHVIATLHKLQQHYLLVSMNNNSQNVLRGIFVDSQIGKQLGINISTTTKHYSIAELQHRLSQ